MATFKLFFEPAPRKFFIIQQVYHQNDYTRDVISATEEFVDTAIEACEEKVTTEVFLELKLDMSTVAIYILMRDSKVYQIDDTGVLESNKDVSRLDVIVNISDLVQYLYSLYQLDNNFVNRCVRELLVWELLQKLA